MTLEDLLRLFISSFFHSLALFVATILGRSASKWFLRSLADANCGMLRICAVFHRPRFLEKMTHLLCLIVLPLLTLVVTMEHSKLEQIELSATIHASFHELKPIH